MTARIGVITFPGTLDDVDAARAARHVGAEAVSLWHADADLKGVDAVVVPGGFSYGDYLRTGAIARFAPVMTEVIAAAGRGLPVLGICNGFQILCEAGLLPGVLLQNKGLKFVCKTVTLTVENTDTDFTRLCKKGQELRVIVAHGDGNYFAGADTLRKIENEGQVAFRYRDNPNGAINNIAGIFNDRRNVLGMMPHPENAVDEFHVSKDGNFLFDSVVQALG